MAMVHLVFLQLLALFVLVFPLNSQLSTLNSPPPPRWSLGGRGAPKDVVNPLGYINVAENLLLPLRPAGRPHRPNTTRALGVVVF